MWIHLHRKGRQVLSALGVASSSYSGHKPWIRKGPAWLQQTEHIRGHVSHRTEHIRGPVSHRMEHISGHVSHKTEHIRGHVSHRTEHIRGHVSHKTEHIRGHVSHGTEHISGHVSHKTEHIRGHVSHRTEHIRGHVTHRYSVMVGQVMVPKRVLCSSDHKYFSLIWLICMVYFKSKGFPIFSMIQFLWLNNLYFWFCYLLYLVF